MPALDISADHCHFFGAVRGLFIEATATCLFQRMLGVELVCSYRSCLNDFLAAIAICLWPRRTLSRLPLVLTFRNKRRPVQVHLVRGVVAALHLF